MQKRLENKVNKQLWQAIYPDWSPVEYQSRFQSLAFDIRGSLKSQDRRSNTVTLRLTECQLVSMIEIDNATAGQVTISLSVEGDQKRHFTDVVIDKTLRTKKVNTVGIGTLPCKYIKLKFGTSKIGSAVVVNSLKLIGCPQQMEEESKVADILNTDVQFQIMRI